MLPSPQEMEKFLWKLRTLADMWIPCEGETNEFIWAFERELKREPALSIKSEGHLEKSPDTLNAQSPKEL